MKQQTNSEAVRHSSSFLRAGFSLQEIISMTTAPVFLKGPSKESIVLVLNAAGPVCSHAQPLVAGTVDAAHEKHVPVFETEDGLVKVRVGSVPHPMTEEHLINFIVLETTRGLQIRELKANEEPRAEFRLADGEEVKDVYAYCNLHGLWKA